MLAWPGLAWAASVEPDEIRWLVEMGRCEEAVKRVDAGVARDDTQSLAMAGMLASRAQCMPHDPGRAIDLLGRAARAGHAEAAMELVQIHGRGIGVPRDYAEAGRWVVAVGDIRRYRQRLQSGPALPATAARVSAVAQSGMASAPASAPLDPKSRQFQECVAAWEPQRPVGGGASAASAAAAATAASAGAPTASSAAATASVAAATASTAPPAVSSAVPTASAATAASAAASGTAPPLPDIPRNTAIALGYLGTVHGFTSELLVRYLGDAALGLSAGRARMIARLSLPGPSVRLCTLLDSGGDRNRVALEKLVTLTYSAAIRSLGESPCPGDACAGAAIDLPVVFRRQ